MKKVETPAAPLPWKPLFANPKFTIGTITLGMLLAAGVVLAHAQTGILGLGTIGAALYAFYAAFPSMVDFAVQRLPNAFTLPAAALAGIWAIVVSAVEADYMVLVRGLVAGFIVFGCWYFLAIIANVGWGDVKFSFAGGVMLGVAGWPAVIGGAGVWLGALMFIMAIFALMAGKRGKDTVPQGPAIAFAAIIGLAFPGVFSG